MSDIRVTIIHPTDGRQIRVTLDPSLTGDEVIDNLLKSGFIESNAYGYKLAIKGGAEIILSETLESSGVIEDNTIRLILDISAEDMNIDLNDLNMEDIFGLIRDKEATSMGGVVRYLV